MDRLILPNGNEFALLSPILAALLQSLVVLITSASRSMVPCSSSTVSMEANISIRLERFICAIECGMTSHRWMNDDAMSVLLISMVSCTPWVVSMVVSDRIRRRSIWSNLYPWLFDWPIWLSIAEHYNSSMNTQRPISGVPSEKHFRRASAFLSLRKPFTLTSLPRLSMIWCLLLVDSLHLTCSVTVTKTTNDYCFRWWVKFVISHLGMISPIWTYPVSLDYSCRQRITIYSIIFLFESSLRWNSSTPFLIDTRYHW